MVSRRATGVDQLLPSTYTKKKGSRLHDQANDQK